MALWKKYTNHLEVCADRYVYMYSICEKCMYQGRHSMATVPVLCKYSLLGYKDSDAFEHCPKGKDKKGLTRYFFQAF